MSSHWDLSDGEQEAVETITDNTTKKESKKQSQLKKDLKQKKRKSQGKVTDTQDADAPVSPKRSKTDDKVANEPGEELGEEPGAEKQAGSKSKSKFKLSSAPKPAEMSRPRVTVKGDEEPDNEDEEDEKPKPKRKTVSESKRKSIKSKAKKRKQRIDALRSTMPKSELEEYLKKQTAGPEEPIDQAALSYLRLWKSTRAAWKFQKVRQCWLLDNIYKQTKIDDKDFDILLEYMEPMKGKSRQVTVDEATEKLNQHKDLSDKHSVVVTRRATQILQLMEL